MYLHSTSKEIMEVLRITKAELEATVGDVSKRLGFIGEVRILGTMLACMKILGDTGNIYKALQKMALLSLPVMAITADDMDTNIPSGTPSQTYERLISWGKKVNEGIDKDELVAIINGKLWHDTAWVLFAITQTINDESMLTIMLDLLESMGMIDLYCKGYLRSDKVDGNDVDFKGNYPAVVE